MIIIGLTGSIAMGKSEVANIFRSEGIPVFDADREVHTLYDSAEGAALLKTLAPDAVIGNRVDRAVLSRIVVETPERLNDIEKIIHAEIAKRRAVFVKAAESQSKAIVVLDVPLLFEKGADKDADVTLVVSAPRESQRQRALARPGMTPEKLDMILERQMPDADKRERADYIIENNGTLGHLRNETLRVLAAIRREHSL